MTQRSNKKPENQRLPTVAIPIDGSDREQKGNT
jgi:hypothetical protein